MAKDRELVMLLCRLLAPPSSALEVTESDFEHSKQDWERLLYIANLHYAAPPLHDALARRKLLGRLPEEIRGYLIAIRHANAERNADLRRQIADFLPPLNAAGIEPVLLKGSAILFDDAEYGEARMMVDIDYLVPPDKDQAAWQIMHEIDYRAVDNDDYSRAHQMNAIYRPGAVAVVEIHRTPGPQRTLLTVEEAYASSTPVDVDGGRCRVMAPTHRLLHLLFHGQVQDFHYWFARPQFRTLLDVIRMIEVKSNEIDWEEVLRRFDGQGYRQVVGGTVALLESWFGVAPPAAVPITRRDRRYVAKCEGRLNRAESEDGFWLRWIGWASVNLMPKRLAYRHELEDKGWTSRLPVVLYRQCAFVVKMATWPYRNYRRRRVRG